MRICLTQASYRKLRHYQIFSNFQKHHEHKRQQRQEPLSRFSPFRWLLQEQFLSLYLYASEKWKRRVWSNSDDEDKPFSFSVWTFQKLVRNPEKFYHEVPQYRRVWSNRYQRIWLPITLTSISQCRVLPNKKNHQPKKGIRGIERARWIV